VAGEVAGQVTGEYALDGLAVPETLNLLHDLLEQVGRDHPGVAVEDLSMFETAVIEIAGNVVEHGLPPGEVTYGFRLVVRPDRLEATLWDSGGLVPEAEHRVTGGLPDEWSEQGRGLVLAGTVLDDLGYQRVAGGNRWQMTRLRR
jgi:serine/threonine-protein kinase RsbW